MTSYSPSGIPNCFRIFSSASLNFPGSSSPWGCRFLFSSAMIPWRRTRGGGFLEGPGFPWPRQAKAGVEEPRTQVVAPRMLAERPQAGPGQAAAPAVWGGTDAGHVTGSFPRLRKPLWHGAATFYMDVYFYIEFLKNITARTARSRRACLEGRPRLLLPQPFPGFLLQVQVRRVACKQTGPCFLFLAFSTQKAPCCGAVP